MTNITLVRSDDSWIEGEALRQLEATAKLPGVVRAVGLPDLHPGKGIPIGAGFLTHDIIYPHLVGNDIGCGMALWRTDLTVRKFKLDKSVKKLTGFEDPWEGESSSELTRIGLPPDLWPYALGTIGSGNHFAEFQKVEKIYNKDIFEAAEFDASKLMLLIHSGSRGLGEHILRQHVDRFKSSGLECHTNAFRAYIEHHDAAVTWAKLNRDIIAQRFLGALGLSGHKHLDITHNSVTPYASGGWLHRKGAAPSDKGLIVIPGSRGTLTYLVRPRVAQTEPVLHSLAHGAGRKWKRSDAKGRLANRYTVSDLTRTSLGGRVICEEKSLIYEEAPEAYKTIETVISDLLTANLIDVVATLRPLITYKTRRR